MRENVGLLNNLPESRTIQPLCIRRDDALILLVHPGAATLETLALLDGLRQIQLDTMENVPEEEMEEWSAHKADFEREVELFNSTKEVEANAAFDDSRHFHCGGEY
jgi:hypothetical protein